jgi:hypothetical protein
MKRKIHNQIRDYKFVRRVFGLHYREKPYGYIMGNLSSGSSAILTGVSAGVQKFIKNRIRIFAGATDVFLLALEHKNC